MTPENSAQSDEVMLSDHLRVEVRENGRMKVSLSFLARATRNLDVLIPEDVKANLDTRGIDLHQIVKEAYAARLAPQELFHLAEDTKSVRVWLE